MELEKKCSEIAWMQAEKGEVSSSYNQYMAKTGLDAFSQWGNAEFRSRKASVLLEVRRLRNDSRRLRALAYSMLDGIGCDRVVLFDAALKSPTSLDYKEWAEGVAA